MFFLNRQILFSLLVVGPILCFENVRKSKPKTDEACTEDCRLKGYFLENGTQIWLTKLGENQCDCLLTEELLNYLRKRFDADEIAEFEDLYKQSDVLGRTWLKRKKIIVQIPGTELFPLHSAGKGNKTEQGKDRSKVKGLVRSNRITEESAEAAKIADCEDKCNKALGYVVRKGEPNTPVSVEAYNKTGDYCQCQKNPIIVAILKAKLPDTGSKEYIEVFGCKTGPGWVHKNQINPYINKQFLKRYGFDVEFSADADGKGGEMTWQKPKPPVPEEFKGGAEECNAKCQSGEGHIIIHPGANLKGEGNTSQPAINPKGGGHTPTIPPGASPKGDGHTIPGATVLQPHAANADKVMYIATGVVKKWVAQEAEYDTCKCVVNQELIEHLDASGLPQKEFATAFEKGPDSGRVWLTMHNITVSYHRPAWVDELAEKKKRAQEEEKRLAEERRLAEEKSKKKRHRFFRFGRGPKSRRR